ncbi:MAG: ATP-binding protein [Nitrospiraceae bacterium]|nr:ATP-binding protein [Nitrospiraceae bacterium]
MQKISMDSINKKICEISGILIEELTILGQKEIENETCPICGQKMQKRYVEQHDSIRTVFGPCQHCEQELYEKTKQRQIENERKQRISKLFSISELGESFQKKTFETWIHNVKSENSYNEAVDYIEQFERYNGKGIVFYGGVGCGKTHLACAILHELIERGYVCLFKTLPDLFTQVYQSIGQENGIKESEIISILVTVDVLFLDDLGTEKATDFKQEFLFKVINGRYLSNKPTIITTNYDVNGLQARIGDKITSRLIEKCIISHNTAADYRRKFKDE